MGKIPLLCHIIPPVWNNYLPVGLQHYFLVMAELRRATSSMIRQLRSTADRSRARRVVETYQTLSPQGTRLVSAQKEQMNCDICFL